MSNIIKGGFKSLLTRPSPVSNVLRSSSKGRSAFKTDGTASSASEHSTEKLPPRDSEEFAKLKAKALEKGSIDFTFRGSHQDYRLLKNIDSKYLEKVCRRVWFADRDIPKYNYLEEVTELPKELPVHGAILGGNMMWINLACQAEEMKLEDGKLVRGPVKYITFFVAPNFPFTYLTKEAMDSLAHELKSWTPEKEQVEFYPAQLGIEAVYLTPENSFVSGVNILGNNILKRSKLGLFVDYGKNYFKFVEPDAK